MIFHLYNINIFNTAIYVNLLFISYICIPGNVFSAFRFHLLNVFSSHAIMTDKRHVEEELLAGISELFLTYGLRSTSMHDICVQLRISKKTLYQIFENKDDVVKQVMFYRIGKRRKMDTVDRLEMVSPIVFINDIKRHIIEELNTLMPANYFDLKKYHPVVYKEVEEENEAYFEAIMTVVLQKGLDSGYFREDINLEIQIYLLTHQFNVLRETELVNSGEHPKPLLVNTIIDNFILALSSAKGLTEFERIQQEEKNEECSNKNE